MRVRALTALGLVHLGALAVAQQPTQPPRFRSGVDVIRIEVSVLDRDRKPLRALTRSDFTILQDGAPQEIVAFEEVAIADSSPSAPVWEKTAAPDVQTNALPEGRLIILLLDDAMEPGQFAERTREIARNVVDRLGPDDRAAVVFTRDNSAAQDFTSDRSRLYAAISRFSVGFAFFHLMANPASRGDTTYFRYSIDTIGEIAKSLAEIPHRRKVLVYIGIGVPTSLVDATTPAEIGSDSGTSADLQGAALTAIGALGDALRRARRSNISVYSIDTAGLGGLDAYAQHRPGFVPPPNLMRDYLRTIADATGGRAAVELNDFRPAVERVFSENSSYYVIGYRATTPPDDRKFRRLEVKVNRRGVLVRARSGFDPAPPPRKNATPATPLGKALSGVLPDDGIAMQVTAAPFATAGRDPVVAIVAGVRHPVVNNHVLHEIQLLTSAFTHEGQPRSTAKQVGRLRLRPDATDDASYEVLSQIALKPGRYSLRIAAHNQLIGRTGSVYYDLVVPNFEKEELSLSGALVTATPQSAAAPKDALAKITTVIPTSRRQFEKEDTATVVVRVYQRRAKQPRPVTMIAKISDSSGSEVFTRRDEVPAHAFPADRAVDYRFDIPLAQLARGEHLVTLEATAGSHTARRELRISVR